jgi:hypothetical protein
LFVIPTQEGSVAPQVTDPSCVGMTNGEGCSFLNTGVVQAGRMQDAPTKIELLRRRIVGDRQVENRRDGALLAGGVGQGDPGHVEP